MRTTTSHSSFTDPPPAYELQTRPSTDNPFSSLHRLSTSSSVPPFTSPAFVPSHNFQIETPGKPVLSIPLLPRPGPIPIFSVPGTTTTPSYLSLRPVPSSGSSYLVSPTPQGESRPLSTTTYRFGPGRPPVVRLFRPGHGGGTPPNCGNDGRNPIPHADEDLALATFPITSTNLFTRSVTFSCSALDPSPSPETGTGTGSFTWRYIPSHSSERQTLGFEKAGSLLVLEYIPSTPKRRVFPAYPGSTTTRYEREGKTIIAALVRNDEFRSRGTRASDAGNGGRVMVDCEFFSGGGGVGEEEERREMGTVMVLTTALVMLKREVDRS